MSKFTVTKTVEVPVLKLRADMGVRYWEDANVNGVDETDEDPKIPLRNGDRWVLTIDLATGQIEQWPEGFTASTHYKVCDDGEYSLIGENGEIVIKRDDGYVPCMLSPSGEGFGDYVIMDIEQNGRIAQWKADLSYFEGYDQ